MVWRHLQNPIVSRVASCRHYMLCIECPVLIHDYRLWSKSAKEAETLDWTSLGLEDPSGAEGGLVLIVTRVFCLLFRAHSLSFPFSYSFSIILSLSLYSPTLSFILSLSTAAQSAEGHRLPTRRILRSW